MEFTIILMFILLKGPYKYKLIPIKNLSYVLYRDKSNNPIIIVELLMTPNSRQNINKERN